MRTNYSSIFSYLFSLILVPAVLSGCQRSSADEASTSDTPARPNIIFIMADDLGYADLGCYGQQLIQTPNLDQMAAEGMRFTQHYAGSAVCAPSRCALMTGMHMGHAQVRGNAQAQPSGQAPITDEAFTVAELLKQGDYETALVGKWGLGVEGTSGDPLQQGFDTYYGYLDQVLAHNYYPEYLLRDGEKEMLANEVKYLDTSAWHEGLGSYATEKIEYSHDLFTEEALRFIEKPRDNPFFLYMALTIPHNNGEAPAGEKQEVPSYEPYADQDWPSDTRGYAAMITRMDQDIGRILEKLQQVGMDENTLLIFTSDNGPMPDKDFTDYFDSNGPLRGGKRFLYEGGIRVPMIARWPGHIAPGTESDHLSAFWDFLATAGDVAGLPIPEDTDGLSYLPAMVGEEQPEHEYLYWEFPEKGYSLALRKGQWKAVRNNLRENPDAPVELYNLEQDLGEENNVADQHPEVVQELTRLMQEAHRPSERFPMPEVNF